MPGIIEAFFDTALFDESHFDIILARLCTSLDAVIDKHNITSAFIKDNIISRTTVYRKSVKTTNDYTDSK